MTTPPAPHQPSAFDRRWRRLSWWQRIPVIIAAAAVGVFVSMVALGFIVGPQDDDEPTAASDHQDTEEPAPTEDESEEPTPSEEPEPEPELEEEPEPDPSPSETLDMDAIREEAGLPPDPDAETAAAYIAALDAIDPRIDKDNPDSAISRGANQCRTIGEHPDDLEHQIDLANQRFTHPDAPNGWGLDVAEQINAVVHEHLCPDF